MLFATDGIITRVTYCGYSDKYLEIITPEKGRIGVIVKGGKSANSKYTPVSQLFIYGNFELYEKNGAYWLRGGSIIKPFYNISKDIESVALATYLCDLANELTDENENANLVLQLLLNSLYLIEQQRKNKILIKAVFELRIASISGYMPDTSGCIYCGEPIKEAMFLDILGGEMFCSDCMNKRQKQASNISREFEDYQSPSILMPMTPAVTAAFRYVIHAPSKKIFSFDITDEVELSDFSRLAENYILHHLGRSFDTLDFYKSIK